jgi:hypothetical protein
MVWNRLQNACGRRQYSSHRYLDIEISAYSTVTDLARLRGWSTSVPTRTAV